MRRLAVASVLVSLAAPARAVNLSNSRIDFTSTTEAGWHADNGNASACDDTYGDVYERLNIAASYPTDVGDWTLGLRLDTATFASPPGESTGCTGAQLSNRYEGHYLLEKASIGLTTRSFEATLGDSYVSFGRGLALSLRKIDELGVDTTLRGGKLLVRAAPFEASLVAGVTNITNVDEASGRHADDPMDLVVGLAGEAQIDSRVGLGGHGVLYAFQDPVVGFAGDAYEEKWLLYGPVIDAPRLSEHLGVYLEGIGQQRAPAGAEAEDGYGLYGAATIYAGRLTFLVEGKAYGDLRVPGPKFDRPDEIEFQSVQYASPPTVERVLQPLEHTQREIAGARLRVDAALIPSLLVFASDAFFRDYQGYADPASGETQTGSIHDPYVGVEARWDQARSRALVSAGWRLVFADGNSEPVRGDAHLDFDAVESLSEAFSLELHGVHMERKKALLISTETWREGTLQLGVRFRPWLSAAAILDYTTEPTQTRDRYWGGMAEWDFSASSSVRVFAGSSRGGLRCISGVCRVFPPFEGVRVALTLRF